MKPLEKERWKLTLQYIGLGVLVVVTLAVVIYLMGTPEWKAPMELKIGNKP